MKSSNLFRVAITTLALTVAACSSTPAKDAPEKEKSAKDKPLTPANPFRPDSVSDLAAKERKLDADGLYRQARLALDTYDFSTALNRYDQLNARFPFTEYATQADLERVYAFYRSFQPDDALSAADRFLKEHPRHAAADYIQYIKGLVNSSRDEGLSGAIGLDTTKEDVGYLRRAFDDFSLLAQKYPASPYAGDARQRMIDLRNRIAEHDLHIVHYYVKRGAFIAAAKRAEQILLQYPGAPSTIETMVVLEQSYRRMGQTEQADIVQKLLAAQRAQPTPKSEYPVAPRKPGFFKGKAETTNAAAPAAIVDTKSNDKPTNTDERSWLRRLFSPGNQEMEGATLVIPTTSDEARSPAESTTAKSDAKPAQDGAIRGSGFSITMEPYDDEGKKTEAPATKP